MNQTYFECYEFDDNVVLIPITTCTYKLMLNWVRNNQSTRIWISILLTHLYIKFHEYLWVAKKRFIADLLFKPKIKHIQQNEIKQYFWQKLLRVNNFTWKSFSKMYSSEWTISCRSCHSYIKLTHTT